MDKYLICLSTTANIIQANICIIIIITTHKEHYVRCHS